MTSFNAILIPFFELYNITRVSDLPTMTDKAKGPSINDVAASGGEGVKDFVTTVLKPWY